MTREDPQLRSSLEWGTIMPIILANGEACSRQLASVSAVLASPLHQWFSDRACQALAVALEAALRGEIKPDHGSLTAYLGGLPHATLFEILNGRPVQPWKAGEYESSALASIGGYTATTGPNDWAGAAPAGMAAKTLRNLVERGRALDAIKAISAGVARCDLNNGPGASLAAGIDLLAGLIGGSSSGRNLGDCLESAIATAELSASLRANGQSNPCSWGVPALDLLCPLRPGMLVLLAAPPGCGKTSLALQCAAATAESGGKGSVALVSLEMTGEELATILAARELKISPSSIRDWTPAAANYADEIRRIAAEWRTSESMTVRDLGDGSKHTSASVSAWIRQRKTVSGGRLALGVVDYVGLLDGEGRQTEQDKLSEATKTLKRTAMSLRLPVLCLSQMNREGRKAIRDKNGAVTANPEPRPEDLRGSGSLEQDADAIVFIHFPEADRETSSPRGKIIVAKHRGGATGSIDVIFHRRHQLFQDLPPVPRGEPERMSVPPSSSEDLFA